MDLVLVKGKKNYAVYDFQHNQIIRLNQLSLNIIKAIHSLQKYSNRLYITAYMIALNNLQVFPRQADYDEAKAFIDSLSVSDLIDRWSRIEVSSSNHCVSIDNSQVLHVDFAFCELTHRCNLKCVHCYADAGAPEKYEMKVNEWQKIIDDLITHGLNSIQFTGGEIFIVRQLLWQLVDYCHIRGIRVDLFTNLTLMKDEDISFLKQYGLPVATTILGSKPGIHDKITKVRGSFAKTTNVIKKLIKHNIPIRVAIIAMKENKDDLENISKLLKNLGVHDFRTPDPIRTAGRGQDENVSESGNAGITNHFFKITRDVYTRNQYWNSCWAFKIAIKANGDVMPCIFTRDLRIGNLLKHNAASIIKKSLPYWRITKDQIEDCQNCEYRYLCNDCRAMSYNDGNLLSKMKRCILREGR